MNGDKKLMAEPRISRGAGNQLALTAIKPDLAQQLQPQHWEQWQANRMCGRCEIAPQAEEWESALGFVPDQRNYLEYGYLVVDELLRQTIVVCRVLVDRREPGSVVRIEWYPTNLDPRKRPN
jgi:hypothetical protein